MNPMYADMPMSRGRIESEFSELIEVMMWIAVLSKTEAISAIEGYQTGLKVGRDWYGPEAVGHFGGCTHLIETAMKSYGWYFNDVKPTIIKGRQS